MWKSPLSVVNNRIVLHNGRGKRCGNLLICVEKEQEAKVFHISTGLNNLRVLELWKITVFKK